jgi:hypothetical protein
MHHKICSELQEHACWRSVLRRSKGIIAQKFLVLSQILLDLMGGKECSEKFRRDLQKACFMKHLRE